MPTAWHLVFLHAHETVAEGGKGVPGSGIQLGGSLAGGQDRARVGVLGIASERAQLYTFLICRKDVDLEDWTLYCPFPCLFCICVRLGGADLDARDPTRCGVRIPGDEDRALWSVDQHKTLVEARSHVLPLLGRWLDHKEAFFQQIVAAQRGYQGLGLFHHLGSSVGQKVPPAAGIERDLDTGASSGLHIWMQEGLSQVLVRAVDIVGQVATDWLPNLSRFKV